MAEPIFDKEGNLSNLEELSVDEVATAYSTKNKELYGRMTEAENREKQAKADKAKVDEDLKVELARVKPSVDTSQFASADDMTDLKLGQKGLDEDAARFVKTYAKGLGKNALEVLDDPTVKDFLQSRKDRQNHENAVPDPSSRTVTVGDKPLSEMTSKEKKANWGNVVKAASRK